MPSLGPGGQRRQTSTRAGRYVRETTGYYAFHPAPFPPTDLTLTPDLVGILSRADQALGRLAGSTEILPNPDLFVFMYVRREAVLSSQIEGTQASLMDILEFEAERYGDRTVDFREVSNYISALRYGLRRVRTLPPSKRLIREIHARLMKGVRGGEEVRTPGEFRRSQNWIGGPTPLAARYVPPPVGAMEQALDELEQFLHSEDLPLLVRAGLAHAQFETIHPFQDGNGRLGRLLISFMLCHAGVLREPLLYLSVFFKKHRQDYYDSLQAVRDDGTWEAWLAFFLEGVASVADEATDTARRIVRLREDLRRRISATMGRRSGTALRLLDHLFRSPVVTVKGVQRVVDLSQPAAAALVAALENAKVLRESSGRRRDRVFRFESYLALFGERESRG